MNDEILTEATEQAPTDVLTELTNAEAEVLAKTPAEEPAEEPATPAEATAPPESTGADELENLRAELDSLRRELHERRGAFERMQHEIGEFSELFPATPLSSLPDSVWESVRAGIPLAASVALYERRAALAREEAERANRENAAASTGSVGRGGVETFFSPSDVRAMSREEVRSNYTTILESMKRWN